MSREKPENIDEWVDHVLEVIHVDDLLGKALNIATPAFERMMEAEGYTPSEILTIYRAVALRFSKEGMRIPSEISGSSVNYLELSRHEVPPDVED